MTNDHRRNQNVKETEPVKAGGHPQPRNRILESPPRDLAAPADLGGVDPTEATPNRSKVPSVGDPSTGAKGSFTMSPDDKRDLSQKRLAERLEALRLTKPPRVMAMIEGCPALYRNRYMKALLGELSPNEERRAFCEACVGWEDTKRSVGGCKSLGCVHWLKRPYQTGEEETDSHSIAGE